MENVVALWLTLNGSSWATSAAWAMTTSLATLAVPADTPRIRLASDTVTTLLQALCTYESVSLRCWVLSMQALAWIASLPLQTEGSTQTMGRVILECEHFVPALVRFINMDVSMEGMVNPSEAYLAAMSIGAGAGAAAALHSVVSRVVCARGAAGALAALRVVAGACGADTSAAAPHDLRATLLRLAHPMLQVLQPKHAHHALPLLRCVASQCSVWVRELGCAGGAGAVDSDVRASGMLVEMVVGGGRRAASRRSVLGQLLAYTRRVLQAPLPVPMHHHHPGTSGSSSSADQSQTDESKAQHSGTDSTNMEDEKKQQAARTPCLADTVIQHTDIMQQFYKALSLCDNLNMLILNSGGPSSENSASIKEEVFWLVAQIATISANPAAMVPGLMEYLGREEIVHLSQGMQQFIIRLLENPEALAAFIDNGGLELSVDKLSCKHQSGPSHKQGLVSSLMNYLKLPPQLVNLSTANKKVQPLVVETATGLINIAPQCSISCGNPTAQAADVLLEGGGSAGGARGACAARRVRAAAWSYHFFSADDSSLALTLALPYAARLHEVQLQPHLTSLATCPGAVGIEAGCGGTVVPLGPPQNTAGMTFIRLVVVKPVVCTTVQLRLYKPRDSSNMGLLQLRLLVAPAFNTSPYLDVPNTSVSNNWAHVVSCCTRGSRLAPARWAALGAPGAVAALCACVGAGGGAALAAHRALLAAARALPAVRDPLLHALLAMDKQAYAHAFQVNNAARTHSGLASVCSLLRQLCRAVPPHTARAYLLWLRASAPPGDPPAPPTVHTLAEVLWMLKEKQLMENMEELISDELFDTVFNWIRTLPPKDLLKNALDAVLCSMCYIRPELFKFILESLKIPVDLDESMEGLTDDTKVHTPPSLAGGGGAGPAAVARRLTAGEVSTLSAAAMSPAATLILLNSRLPAAVVCALTEFAEERLNILKEEVEESSENGSSIGEVSMTEENPERADVACMSRAASLVEWVRQACAERRAKEWAGGAGSAFWRPLLRLLCYPLRADTTWQESFQFSELEDAAIQLFAELTACHPPNQKRFANTLHSILETMPTSGHLPEGISGFTRALILRLVLTSERVDVALRWTGAGVEPEGAACASAAPLHPSLAGHAVLALPADTTVRDLLTHYRPPLPVMDETSKLSMSTPTSSGTASVLRSASDTAITTVAEAWELSLAAASASKDKRVKDVKNTSLKNQNTKKRQTKNDTSVVSVTDDLIETTIRVQAVGLEGFVSGNTTLGQLCASVPQVLWPHLTLVLHLNTSGEWSGAARTPATSPSSGAANSPAGPTSTRASGAASSAMLREFGVCGGLALVAARLPRPHAPPPDPPAKHTHHHDLDWVKLDDPYELVLQEVVELGGGGEEAACGIPAHALAALGLLLKLPGYAAALLDEGAKAVHLLRLLMGVAYTEDGRNIVVGGHSGFSLGTLPFRVVSRLLEAAPRRTEAGAALRRTLLQCGAARMVLACLAVFTHHRPTSAENSQGSNGSGRPDEKPLYWAKGTGFGTGSTQQSWNVEQALVRQRTEEEHVTVLLQVLAAYMNPGEQWPPEESTQEEIPSTEDGDEDLSSDLPPEFLDLVAGSSLGPALCSYLRNDSVLDMSRHIPLYVCVLRSVRALHALRSARLAPALRPLPRLLHQMSRTTNSYATKLKMSKKNIFGKMTYSQRFSTSSNSELSEEDEGLASLIADIQATSALICRSEAEMESNAPSTRNIATREQRYIDLMRTLQFETFEMISECPENGFRFTVPYHFEGTVRAAGERSAPARMKRLAQEAATLATSLPLSYSSSVFVRTDTDRLDVMKVLITGPSDTPYANGCFILDVYFPAEYPAVPMLINLETTGRHSVRFNPNLYNDGKVCLSVLNTWHGRPEEKWNAHTSSFLQVLVSIQSLILVPEPYFNEPGYERSRGSRVGAAASTEYNSNIYQACVRWAMLDQLKNPEPCFKEVIQTHFWIKRNEIMKTVATWIAELENQHGDERTQRSIHHNAMTLKRHFVKLVEELGKLTCPAGLEALDEPFVLPAAPAPPPPRSNEDIDHDMEKIVSQVLD